MEAEIRNIRFYIKMPRAVQLDLKYPSNEAQKPRIWVNEIHKNYKSQISTLINDNKELERRVNYVTKNIIN